MGVSGLWAALAEAGTSHNLETLQLKALVDDGPTKTSSSNQRRLPTIGVDLSAWLFHARLSVEGSNPILRLIFFRLTKLLALPIQAVFVFDGPLRPRVKRGKTVGGKKHPLTGPLMEMIKACGAIGWEAPGEAEAELARMNQEGLIDGVLSDDVDALVFGAKAVMRNWSATLSGSRASASEDAGENTATIYRSSDIMDLPDLGLDTDGLVFVAMLVGGDYDVNGLGGCGPKIAIALAQAGLGSKLVAGFRKHCKITGHDPDSKMPTVSASYRWRGFVNEWLAEAQEELETNKQGFLSRREAKLARSEAFKSILSTDESLEVLASYIHPVTTWSLMDEPGTSEEAPRSRPPTKLKFRKPNVTAMASFAQRTFAWGPKATVGRLRNVAWKGLLLRELLEEAGYIENRSSRLDRVLSSEEDEEEASARSSGESHLLAIHSERRHASTGSLLEYRVEWDPSRYARLAEKGIDPMLNVGPGYDEDFPEDMPDPSQASVRSSPDSDSDEAPPCSPYGLTLGTADGCPPSPSKRKAKPPPDPYSSLRTWILADRLEESVRGRQLIREYSEGLAAKKTKGKTSKTKSTAKATGRQTTLTGRARSGPAGTQRSIDSVFSSQKPSTSRVVAPAKPKPTQSRPIQAALSDSEASDHAPVAPTTNKPLARPASRLSSESDSAPARRSGPPSSPHRPTSSQSKGPPASPLKQTLLNLSPSPRAFSRTQSGPATLGRDGLNGDYLRSSVTPTPFVLPRATKPRPISVISLDDDSMPLSGNSSEEDGQRRRKDGEAAAPRILSQTVLPTRMAPITIPSTPLRPESPSSRRRSGIQASKNYSPMASSDPDTSLPDADTFLRQLTERRVSLRDTASPNLVDAKRTRMRAGRGMREGSPDPISKSSRSRGSQTAEKGRRRNEMLVSSVVNGSSSGGTRFHPSARSQMTGGGSSTAKRLGGRKSDAIELSDSD